MSYTIVPPNTPARAAIIALINSSHHDNVLRSISDAVKFVVDAEQSTTKGEKLRDCK